MSLPGTHKDSSTARPTCPRLLHCTIVAMLFTVLGGCGGNPPTPYDHLVADRTAINEWSSLDDVDAIALIDSLGYSALRDSLTALFQEGTRVNSRIYELDSLATAALVDSSVIVVGTDDDANGGINWLRRLLPEIEAFASPRSAEKFTYHTRSDAMTGFRSLHAVAVDGAEVPGGLRSIHLMFEPGTNQIRGLSVWRNSSGLFFGEKSRLDMSFEATRPGQLSEMNYTVVLRLPFRGPTAFRTMLSMVNGAG